MPLAITDKYKGESDFSSKMKSDLGRISALLKSSSPNWSSITFPSPLEMQQLLHRIYALSSNNKLTQPVNHKLLRIYLFLISRYQANIWPVGPAAELVLLNTAIKTLSETIGVVPRLSHPVVWADQKFLPPEINKKTKKKWQKQPCLKPRRGQTISKNEVHFIGTPREALKERYSGPTVERVETSSGDLYLNLIDFDYYKLGLMDADHLLASASLLNRVQEMIETMNYDPTFAREMKNSIFNDDYFITNSDGSIVGNYWLYMAYHNSIENLWLLLASDNSAGKGAEDPLVWLSQFEIGQKYLAYLVDEGKYIDKSDILYRVSDDLSSISLKDSFTGWVRESHKTLILVYKSEAELHGEIRGKIASAQTSKKRLRLIYGNIEAARAHFLTSDVASDSGCSQLSVETGFSEFFMRDVAKAISEKPEIKKLYVGIEHEVTAVSNQVAEENGYARKRKFTPT